MKEFKHRCKKWDLDVKIHPELDWVYGTCMWYIHEKWFLLDEKSGTFSTYKYDVCPCCGVGFEEILNGRFVKNYEE